MKKLAMATIICTIACLGPALAQGPVKSDYYPLNVGARWTYRHIDVKSAQPKADQKRFVVIEVEREEPYTRKVAEKDGKEVVLKDIGFILKSTSGGKTTRDHVVVLQDGVHKIHVAGTLMSPPLLFFKLPPVESWPIDSKSGNTHIKGTYTAKIDSVKVPAGKFDAYLVSFSNNKTGEERHEIKSWIAPKIGMVKQHVKTKNHEIILELEKYEPAK